MPMCRAVAILLMGLCSIAWAEEDLGVISVDELRAAQTAEHNTYRNEQAGISITAPDGWQIYAEGGRSLPAHN